MNSPSDFPLENPPSYRDYQWKCPSEDQIPWNHYISASIFVPIVSKSRIIQLFSEDMVSSFIIWKICKSISSSWSKIGYCHLPPLGSTLPVTVTIRCADGLRREETTLLAIGHYDEPWIVGPGNARIGGKGTEFAEGRVSWAESGEDNLKIDCRSTSNSW